MDHIYLLIQSIIPVDPAVSQSCQFQYFCCSTKQKFWWCRYTDTGRVHLVVMTAKQRLRTRALKQCWDIQGVPGGIVNILGCGSMDYVQKIIWFSTFWVNAGKALRNRHESFICDSYKWSLSPTYSIRPLKHCPCH